MEVRNVYKIYGGKPEKRDHSENVCVGGRILINSTVGKSVERFFTGFIWLRL
jgi:hypothetical protein